MGDTLYLPYCLVRSANISYLYFDYNLKFKLKNRHQFGLKFFSKINCNCVQKLQNITLISGVKFDRQIILIASLFFLISMLVLAGKKLKSISEEFSENGSGVEHLDVSVCHIMYVRVTTWNQAWNYPFSVSHSRHSLLTTTISLVWKIFHPYHHCRLWVPIRTTSTTWRCNISLCSLDSWSKSPKSSPI